MDKVEDAEDDAYALGSVFDGISKISLDDYTYVTETVGHKSRHYKVHNPTVVSSGSALTQARRGGRESFTKSKSSTVYGLSSLGLPYCIDR